MRFTQATIAALKCPAGKKDILTFDDGMRGFGLRVTARGAKTFLVQYRCAAGLRRMVLDKYGVLTLEQARQKAREVLGEAAKGLDPFQIAKDKEKAAVSARREAKDADTLEGVVSEWVKARAADRKPRYIHEVANSIRRHLATYLDEKADSLSRADVQRKLDGVRGTAGPIAANRLLAYGNAVFERAVRRQTVKLNPFHGIERPAREVSRDRVLSDVELGAIWRAAGAIGWLGGNFTRLLMLTLARRNEIASMEWSEISPDGSTWVLPAARSKNGKAHSVHLSPAARDVIGIMPRMAESSHVFATTRRTGLSGFSAFKRALDRAMAAEGLDVAPWRFHDFRRSGVTWLALAGWPPHVADKLLNHTGGSISGVQAVYQRHEFHAERKRALETWADHVLACGAGEAGERSNVITLHGT